MVMVMVMVIWLWLWLYISVSTGPYHATSIPNSGPVRRERRRASNTGKQAEEPSLARPHFVALSRSQYGIIPPPLALGAGCWGPAIAVSGENVPHTTSKPTS